MDGIIVQKHFDGFIEIVKYLYSNIQFGNWSLSCFLFHFVGVYSVSDALLFSLIHWTDVCSSYTSHFLRIFFFACRSSNNIRILTSGLGRLKTSEHLFMYAHILIQFLFIEQFHREFYSLFFPLRCNLSGLTRVVNINVYDSSCCFSHSQRNIHRETWWKKSPPKS